MKPVRSICTLAILAGLASAQSIAGRVVDAKGEPAPGVFVHIVWRQHAELPAGWARLLGDQELGGDLTLTDEAGRFKLKALASRTYTLYAVGKEESQSPLMFPVFVHGFHELRLQPTEKVQGRASIARPGWRKRRRPVVGARVRVSVLPQTPRNSPDVFPLPQRIWAQTDALASFEFRRLPDHETQVLIWHGGSLLWKSLGGDTQTLALDFPAPSQFVLKVEGEDKQLDLKGTRVQLTQWPFAAWNTDVTGACKISTAQSFPLHVIPEKHQRFLARSPKGIRAMGQPRIAVRLRKGLKLEARLLSGEDNPLTGARLVFAGPVEKPAGALAAGRCAQMQPMEVYAWTDRVGEDGRVVLGCLTPDLPIAGFVEVEGRFSWFLFRCPDSNLDLGTRHISTAGSLVGKVDTWDRRPAAGAWVALHPELPLAEAGAVGPDTLTQMSRTVFTDRSGRFRLPHLRPGRYRIHVYAANNKPHLASVGIKTAANKIEVALAEGGVLRGKVQDLQGKPVANASVDADVHPSDWNPAIPALLSRMSQTCKTNGRGEFILRGLLNLPYSLSAAKGMHATRRGPTVNPVEEHEEVILVLMGR